MDDNANANAVPTHVLSVLDTEKVNPATSEIDRMSPLEIVQLINAEDEKVALAVRQVLPDIALAIERIAARLRIGGRVIYVGAGTSGRLGALDASECPPTFNIPQEMVVACIAGGTQALGQAHEDLEDSAEAGSADVARLGVSEKDVVIGITASGRTPYTIAAVEHARNKGARTVAVSCNPDTALTRAADIAITAEVGPEVLSGSTRMKAGTAQKMILNMITTGAMTRLGYVYGNLMVNVSLKNTKLFERAITILSTAAEIDREQASRALTRSGRSVPIALIMLKTGISRIEAKRRLRAAAGNVRKAIESSGSASSSGTKSIG